MGFRTTVLTNQYGEQTNNFVTGGTSSFSADFIVDSTNGNGLGLRSLKADPNIEAVYMHTSSTPDPNNPNPAAGFIIVEFSKDFSGYVGGFTGFVTPASGTPINVTAGLTLGQVYIITSLGTTTQAQWQALGLPSNITPAVGIAFTAITASAGVGSGQVQAPLATGAGISDIDVIGNANMSIQSTDGLGGYMILRCLAPTSSSVTTPQATAPADGSVVGLNFTMIPSVNAPVI